ncbi:MAG: hypothetical protein ABWZ90_06415, partial [Acidimicrobiales bacterium]
MVVADWPVLGGGPAVGDDPSLHDTIDPRTSRTPKADVLRRSIPLIGPSSRTWSSGVPWSPKYSNINVVTLLS